MAGGPAEEGVVELINPAGGGAAVVVCEHASNFIPARYDNLGMSPALLQSHIAWDPGALPVANRLSAALDATLIAQRVSRLVYDCNRPPEADSAVPAVSEVHRIPGNEGLSDSERAARAETVYRPFRRAVSALLDARLAAGLHPVLVTVPSFTPLYKGVRRAVDLGVLCDSDDRLAQALLRAAGSRPEMSVRLNEPYGPADGVTHTLADLALPRGLLNVMIEIRNDLIADAAGQAAIGHWLAESLGQALEDVGASAVTAARQRSAG